MQRKARIDQREDPKNGWIHVTCERRRGEHPCRYDDDGAGGKRRQASLEDANRYWNRVFFADEPDRVLEIRRVTAWFRNAAGRKAVAGSGNLVDHHAWTRVEHNQLRLMRNLGSDDGRPD